jgi:hypothetical protein
MVLSKQYNKGAQYLDPSGRFIDEEWEQGFKMIDKARKNASK